MLKEILRKYWNYPEFRPLQEEIASAVVAGRDTLALLPTGGGKSVCYQVPALALEGLCLVISPLIALMQDQVMQLKKRDIAAAFLHSGMTRAQTISVFESARNGELKLLYLAPERLQTDLFLEYAPELSVNLIAVDEAHCISQWGHDFRPSYRTIAALRPIYPAVPVLALTASANKAVQTDIQEQLEMKDPAIFVQSVVRTNLFYHVRYTENKPGDTATLFQSRRGTGILYCRSRKRCVETALQLRNDGIPALVYHAGMNREEREQIQQRWTQSNEHVVCATSAFGMGIDKPNVRTVAHYDLPENMEAYYQEAGRAGRDGQKAYAILFWDQRDIERLQASTEINYPPETFLRKVYQLAGDYLCLSLGAGFEQLLPFDALDFVKKFQLDLLPTLSAIRLLEREGYWQWNEQANMQTIVQFTTDRPTLNFLERTEPALSYIATGLLRLYGSIYHFPTSIKIYEVSKMLRIEQQQLERGLQRMAALGIIDYQPAISGSTLYWLSGRLPDRNLKINTERLGLLRKAHEERVDKMIAFVSDTTRCRNKLLSAYFGEASTENCGDCDVCKARRQQANQTPRLRQAVLKLIREEQQISLSDLVTRFPEQPQAEIIEAVRALNDESLCRVYPSGTIFAT